MCATCPDHFIILELITLTGKEYELYTLSFYGFQPPFIHSVFCLTTGPKSPPKRCLHIVRSRASSFKSEYPLLALRSSSSFLGLLPRLLATSISPFIFPSISCFRRQFLRKMWPIQLAFRFLISCRIDYNLTENKRIFILRVCIANFKLNY